MSDERFRLSRRQLLGSASLASLASLAAGSTEPAGAVASRGVVVPFEGPHQAGILTAVQDHLVFVTFDLEPGVDRAALAALLDSWSSAARLLTAGAPLEGPSGPDAPPADPGEAGGLGPSALSVTLGVGAAFAHQAGLDLSVPSLPPMPGDELDPMGSDGALCLQVCADDPQVAFHAAHALARLAIGTASLRALQRGFGRTSSTTASQVTPRNLLGFKDGTNNLLASDTAALSRHVWLPGSTTPGFLAGGTFLVMRRIRMRLETWTETTLGDQEAAVGRHKDSGAPLGARVEHDPVDLVATGAHGLPVIPAGAHIRVASPSANGGARLLRRGYGFADGLDPFTGELDAGLFFLSFQRDPLRQFAAIQRRLSASDTLHRYLVHTASAVFAIPRGLRQGEGWGSLLLG